VQRYLKTLRSLVTVYRLKLMVSEGNKKPTE
jgi:hypothetical protein